MLSVFDCDFLKEKKTKQKTIPHTYASLWYWGDHKEISGSPRLIKRPDQKELWAHLVPSLKNICMLCKYTPQTCHIQQNAITHNPLFLSTDSFTPNNLLSDGTGRNMEKEIDPDIVSAQRASKRSKSWLYIHTHTHTQCFPSVIKSSHGRPMQSPLRIWRPTSTVPTGQRSGCFHWMCFMRLHVFSLGNGSLERRRGSRDANSGHQSHFSSAT